MASATEGPGSPAALEARLPGLEGVERLRALADLTEAYRSTDPRRAVSLGEEAIALPDTASDPVAYITALNESAWALMEMGRYPEAVERARRGEAVAQRVGTMEGLARARNNLGVLHRRLGAFGEALDRFRQAAAIYGQLGDSAAVATELNNESVVLGFDLGDYSRAFEAQLQALRVRERLGNEQALYQSYNTLGVLYHRVGDEGRAVDHLKRALDGWRSVDVAPRIAATLSNLADVYVADGDLDAAFAAQTESLHLREEVGAPSGIAVSEESLGNILVRMGRLDEARRYLDHSLAERESLGERKNVATSLVSLAHLDDVAGRYQSAEARASRAAALADSMQALDVGRSAFLELSRARESRGDFRGALTAYRRWNALDDSLFTAARSQRIAALDAEYRTDQQQGEIERLRAQAALSAATAQRHEVELIAVVLLGLVIILLYGRRLSRRLRRDLEHQVEERTAELRAVNWRLQDLSLTDTLTGLRNRRYLFQTVESDLAVSLRAYRDADEEGVLPEAADVVFYLIDLDDFKSVNDDHGHAAGDRVLEQVARVLEETGRASDVVIRWGGEEFLILSRGVDRVGAAVFAERVRTAIRDHVFVASEGVTLRRTCSVGFAPYPFVPSVPRAVTWEQVVGLADHAAYAAKRAGRNAWVGLFATDDTPAELVRQDPATLALLQKEGVIEVVSSVAREGGPSLLEVLTIKDIDETPPRRELLH